jgi:CheY-like chemotaxis protein
MHAPFDRPINVVLVDDDLGVLGAGGELLRELGHRVLLAPGSHHALYLLERHPEVELLFTDVVLPAMDGTELAKRAKRQNPELKVLYTSGYPEQVLGRKTIDGEMIPKPLRLEPLITALQHLFPGRTVSS